MPHISRFKLRNSDRSGFKKREIELIKDRQFKVSPDEFDAPAPSKLSLGGEGDISVGDQRANAINSDLASINTIPTVSVNPLVTVTAGGGIRPNTHPWMRISGEGGDINITANPQIVAGRQSDILTLQCVSNGVTLDHGTGLAMTNSQGFIMTSGSIISFFYDTAGNVWQELSRTKVF